MDEPDFGSPNSSFEHALADMRLSQDSSSTSSPSQSSQQLPQSQLLSSQATSTQSSTTLDRDDEKHEVEDINPVTNTTSHSIPPLLTNNTTPSQPSHLNDRQEYTLLTFKPAMDEIRSTALAKLINNNNNKQKLQQQKADRLEHDAAGTVPTTHRSRPAVQLGAGHEDAEHAVRQKYVEADTFRLETEITTLRKRVEDLTNQHDAIITTFTTTITDLLTDTHAFKDTPALAQQQAQHHTMELEVRFEYLCYTQQLKRREEIESAERRRAERLRAHDAILANPQPTVQQMVDTAVAAHSRQQQQQQQHHSRRSQGNAEPASPPTTRRASLKGKSHFHSRQRNSNNNNNSSNSKRNKNHNNNNNSKRNKNHNNNSNNDNSSSKRNKNHNINSNSKHHNNSNNKRNHNNDNSNNNSNNQLRTSVARTGSRASPPTSKTKSTSTHSTRLARRRPHLPTRRQALRFFSIRPRYRALILAHRRQLQHDARRPGHAGRDAGRDVSRAAAAKL
jgi:hypothetical protein